MSICPNDCSVCREAGTPCIYDVPSETCSVCHKKVFLKDLYEIKDKELGIYKVMCSDCFTKFEPEEEGE